ncbi:TPA: hypothetical protein NGR52_004214 [Vibrio parahaemolyticus]|nr:hypothetical protein [Vibrio parahaemolyticus]
MNILGFGTGIATLLSGAATGVAGSLLNKSTYCKESIKINNTMAAGAVSLGIDGAVYNLWLSGEVLHEAGTWLATDLIKIKDNTGTEWFKVMVNTDKTYKIAYWNGSAWIESSNSTYVDAAALHRIDVEYAADAVRLYVDSVLECEMVASITQAANTLLTAELYNPQSESTAHSYWSAVFAADSSTRKTIMNQHTLTADGTHYNDFNGTYDDVDDFATLGESTSINTEFGNSLQTFQKDAVPAALSSGYAVTALGLYARAVENSEVASSLQTVMTDGVTDKLGDLVATPSVYTTIKQIEANANDGGSWNVTKLDAVEVGVKCVI